MAEANIDDIAKNAPQQEKKEEPKVSTLESVVNETLHLGGNSIKLGLATAIPLAQAIFVPQLLNNSLIKRDTAIMTGAQIAADVTTDFKRGKKYTAGSALESSIIGTTATVPLHYLFKVAHTIPLDSALGYVAKAGYWGGIAYPLYTGFYQFLNYVVRNRGIKGVGKYIKENYWSTLKKSWLYLLPISLLNVFFAPPILNIPISAALSYAFALFGAPKKNELKEEEKRDKTPYVAAASNVIGKGARALFYAPLNLAYAVGSSLRDFYKKAPKPAVPTPAPAPAH